MEEPSPHFGNVSYTPAPGNFVPCSSSVAPFHFLVSCRKLSGDQGGKGGLPILHLVHQVLEVCLV